MQSGDTFIKMQAFCQVIHIWLHLHSQEVHIWQSAKQLRASCVCSEGTEVGECGADHLPHLGQDSKLLFPPEVGNHYCPSSRSDATTCTPPHYLLLQSFKHRGGSYSKMNFWDLQAIRIRGYVRPHPSLFSEFDWLLVNSYSFSLHNIKCKLRIRAVQWISMVSSEREERGLHCVLSIKMCTDRREKGLCKGGIISAMMGENRREESAGFLISGWVMSQWFAGTHVGCFGMTSFKHAAPIDLYIVSADYSTV